MSTTVYICKLDVFQMEMNKFNSENSEYTYLHTYF